jgi:hypothetical protein
MHRKLAWLGVPVLLFGTLAWGDTFSFIGTFPQDDQVQLFNLFVGAPSTVTLETTSYADGTDGFDPILALFDSSGNLIGQNDDGGSFVPADPETGAHFDTFLQIPSLAAGDYTVSVMQYDNFAIGPTLADGFARQGQGNFTGGAFGCGAGVAFCDVNVDVNNGNWAFTISGVNSANTVPEPSSLLLLGGGLLIIGAVARRHLKRG